MPRTDLSSSEICLLVGLRYQTLDRWLRVGIVDCDTPAQGTGSRRRFTTLDLTCVLIAQHVRAVGLPMELARIFNALIRRHWTDLDPAHAGCVFTTATLDPTTARWFPDPQRLEAAIATSAAGHSGGIYFALDVRGPARDARAWLDRELRRHCRDLPPSGGTPPRT